MSGNPEYAKKHRISIQAPKETDCEANGENFRPNDEAKVPNGKVRKSAASRNGKADPILNSQLPKDRKSNEIVSKLKALKSCPDWNEWRHKRPPFCKLWECVHLAHNIVTNRHTLERLRENGDARVRQFKNHLNTAMKAVRNNDPLLFHLGNLPEDVKDVELYLPFFVQWAQEQGWKTIPDELVLLKEAYRDFAPSTIKNWDTWRKKPYLTIEEAVCLNHNVDPIVLKDSKARLKYQKFFEEFECDVDMLTRYTSSKLFANKPALEHASSTPQTTSMTLDPVNFVEYAKRFDWNVHPKLLEIATDTSRRPELAGTDAKDDLPVSQSFTKRANGTVHERNRDETIGALYLMLVEVMRHIRNDTHFDVDDFFHKSSDGINHFEVASVLAKTYFSSEKGKSPEPGSIAERIRDGLKHLDGNLTKPILTGKEWMPSKPKKKFAP